MERLLEGGLAEGEVDDVHLFEVKAMLDMSREMSSNPLLVEIAIDTDSPRVWVCDEMKKSRRCGRAAK